MGSHKDHLGPVVQR